MDLTSAEAFISKFRSITNATHEVAINYFSISDGNVEQAVTLYFENPQQSTSRTISVDSESGNTFDSDAELARALAQQETSSIRAPIAPKRDILVGGDQNDHFGHDTGISRRDNPRSRRSRDTYQTFAGEVLPHRMGTADEKATRLAELFSPPFDIISKENFEKTRTRAKNEDKWLMVDIQNIQVFNCQVLNRDLWKHKTVKDVIKAHFLFLQFNSDSADGRQYINFYPIEDYPHIAIIDPRTGERVKVWNTQVAPNEFIISVTDFLERYSLKDQTKPKKSVSKPIVEMSEDDQIRAALQESLKSDKEQSNESEYEYEEVDDENLVNEEPISTFDSIQPVEREEAQGPTSAMIKFRLADGQTIIRRFEKVNPVRYLFEFIKATVPSLKDQQFELIGHRKNLIDQAEQTVEEAGLPNSLVNVMIL